MLGTVGCVIEAGVDSMSRVPMFTASERRDQRWHWAAM